MKRTRDFEPKNLGSLLEVNIRNIPRKVEFAWRRTAHYEPAFDDLNLCLCLQANVASKKNQDR
jgi:hypothetical protein